MGEQGPMFKNLGPHVSISGIFGISKFAGCLRDNLVAAEHRRGPCLVSRAAEGAVRVHVALAELVDVDGLAGRSTDRIGRAHARINLRAWRR